MLEIQVCIFQTDQLFAIIMEKTGKPRSELCPARVTEVSFLLDDGVPGRFLYQTIPLRSSFQSSWVFHPFKFPRTYYIGIDAQIM